MPKGSAHTSAIITKMLLIGASGSGKTGALASLAAAGYKLRILDYDNGLDFLMRYMRKNHLARSTTSSLSPSATS